MCDPKHPEEVPNCAKCHKEQPFEVWAECAGYELDSEEEEE